MEQKHTILKVVMEVHGASVSNAFEMQQALGNYCKKALPTVLSNWLDSCAGDDELLCIGKLEIDIGTSSLNGLVHELGERIIAELNKKYGHLQQASFTMPVTSTDVIRKPLRLGYFEYWLFFLEKGFLPASANIPDKAAWENAVLQTIATESIAAEQCRKLLVEKPSALQRLVLQFSPAFLQGWAGSFYGAEAKKIFQLAEEWEQVIKDNSFRQLAAKKIGVQLPETSATLSDSDLLLIAINTLLHARDKEITTTFLEDLLSANFSAAVRQLWINALQQVLPFYSGSLPVLQQAVKAVVLQKGKAGEKNLDEIVKTNDNVPHEEPPPNLAAETKERVNEIPVPERETGLPVKENSSSEDVVLNNRTDDFLPGKKIDTVEDKNTAENSNAANENIEAVNDEAGSINRRDGIKEEDKNLTAADSKSPGGLSQDDKPSLTIEERFSLFKNEIDNPSTDKTIFKQEDTIRTVEEGTSVYVNNAGLVLLHPFLPAFFESLHLLQDKEFKDDLCRDKAVKLLAFLAHDEIDLQDYELVLPKLLCGISPQQPVDRFVVLSPEEKEAAIELLTAVLQHWKALGNTSPDGLRANFLLREGRLDFKNEQWNLQVTQLVYDMLLDKLPWGFGMIKLPWMSWLLTTIWV